MKQTIGYNELIGGGGYIHPVTGRSFRLRAYRWGWVDHAKLIKSILQKAGADDVITYRNPFGTLPNVPMENDQGQLGWPDWSSCERNLRDFAVALQQWSHTPEVYVGDPEVNSLGLSAESTDEEIKYYLSRVFPYEKFCRFVWDAVSFASDGSVAARIYSNSWLTCPAGIEAWPCRGSLWVNALDVPIFVQSSHMRKLEATSVRADLAPLDDIQTLGQGDLSRFIIFVEDPRGSETSIDTLRVWWKRGASLRIPFTESGEYLGCKAADIKD